MFISSLSQLICNVFAKMWQFRMHQNFLWYEKQQRSLTWWKLTKLTVWFISQPVNLWPKMRFAVYITISILLKESRFLLMLIIWWRSLLVFIRTKYNVHTTYKHSGLQEHFAHEILFLLPWTTSSDCGRNNCKNKSSCFNSCRNNYPSASRLNKAAIFN